MKKETVGAFEAKTHVSALLEKACQGTIIVVTRRGQPVAPLGPAEVGTPLTIAIRSIA
jgi:antitoxin (DNA-binding transcriptional repressor) of toxin-antitoxin stability system